MSSIVDRIKELCTHLKVSENRFAGEIDVNPQTLNNYTSGKRKIGYEVVDKILIRYPQVSAEWLLRGVGSMFCCGDANIDEVFNTGIQQNNVEGNNTAVMNGDAVLQKENELLKKQIEDKDKEIAFLRELVKK